MNEKLIAGIVNDIMTWKIKILVDIMRNEHCEFFNEYS